MKLTLVPSGEFMMGSKESAEETAAFFNKTYGEDSESRSFKDEHPQHRVRITKPFYLGTYHVTRGQFRQFVADTGYKTDAEKGEKPGACGWNPDKKEFDFNEKYSWRNAGFEQTDEHPVVNVSWNDAVAFCKWLSRRKARPTGCQRRPSGNTPAVPGRQPATTAATIPRRWPRSATWPTRRSRRNSRTGNARSKPATAMCSRLRWVIQAQCLRALRHARKCLAVVCGLVRRGILCQVPRRRPNWPRLRRARVLRGGSWTTGRATAVPPVAAANYVGTGAKHLGFRVARTQ